MQNRVLNRRKTHDIHKQDIQVANGAPAGGLHALPLLRNDGTAAYSVTHGYLMRFRLTVRPRPAWAWACDASDVCVGVGAGEEGRSRP